MTLSSEKDMERINNHLPIRRSSIKPLILQIKFNEEILQNRLLIGEITPLNYLQSISPYYQLEFQPLDYSTFLVDTNESDLKHEVSQVKRLVHNLFTPTQMSRTKIMSRVYIDQC